MGGISEKGMSEWLQNLGVNSVAKINEIGEQVVSDAAEYTPVLTGRLKAAWEMKPISKLGDNLVIKNDVEYASEVEYGGVKNEPRMMLRKALARVPKVITVD
jgi:hypothetical protein